MLSDLKVIEDEIEELFGDQKINKLIELCKNPGNIGPDKAIMYGKQAVELSEQQGNRSLLCNAIKELSKSYLYICRYDNALMLNFKLLKMYTEINDEFNIAKVNNMIGDVYEKMHDNERSREYTKKAIKGFEKLEVLDGIADASNNLGIVYRKMKDYKKAILYQNKALEIYLKSNDEWGEAISYNNIGNIYTDLGEIQKSIEYYKKSNKIYEKIGEEFGKIGSLINIGASQRKIKNYDKAKLNLEKSLKWAQKINSKELITENYKELYNLYKEIGEFDKALKYHENYSENEKSIYKQETNEKIEKLQMSHQVDKKEKEAEIYRLKYIELKNLNKQLSEEIKKKDTAERKLKKSMGMIKTLLNNTGQGFLSFGENLSVDADYSKECLNIFKKDIKGIDFIELMGFNKSEEKDMIKEILKKLIEEDEGLIEEIYIPLLPESATLNGKVISIDYKVVSVMEVKKIMIILTDITDKKLLESEIEKEKNLLSVVIKVVVNYDDFMDNINGCIGFFEEDWKRIIAEESSLNEGLLEILRSIHTYKGTFAQFGLKKIEEKLHLYEDEISRLCKNTFKNTYQTIEKQLKELCIKDVIKEEIDILKKYLGDDYFNRSNVVVVDRQDIVEIEEAVKEVLEESTKKELVEKLKKLRYTSLKEMLKMYPEYTASLAARLNKCISLFEIQGLDILVDAKKYKDFTKSLVHVFRNIIDHGIEDVETRALEGKEEMGKIHCKIDENEQNILIIITDDGRGIDKIKIKNVALNKKIIKQNELEKLSEKEVFNLMFEDGFSTKENVSKISGRGVGLAVVKSELEKLGGKVEVFSKLKEGTKFRFEIPKNYFVD